MNPADTERLIRRALGRRAFLRGALAASAGGAALYAVGCGSGDDDGSSPTSGSTVAVTPPPIGTPGNTPGPNDIKPVLLTSEFVAGESSRFAVGLLQGGRLVKDAAVHARFFQLGDDGTTGQLRGEGDLAFVELNVEGAHAHDETGGEAASDDAVSFYVANTPFDNAGKWGVELAVTPQDAAPVAVQVPITVLTESTSPGLGTVPPASHNDTLATNANTESLCSRDPICPLHDKVIADYLGKGRPLVVQFSTPAYCETRFCGPVLEVLLTQVPAYQDKMDFIHIEVWQDFQLKKYRDANLEWKLPTEPYTFLMDGAGVVRGKIEAIFTEEELKQALDKLAAL